jgi:phosphate:Na+ symporter
MNKVDIFSVFTLLGGLAFFLYGILVMSTGLEKIAGGKLEKLLKVMTSNPLKGLMLGAGITALIQSSSAVTVMLVGLVNSGIMKLPQAIGVIMGSNVGTTITAWILSLAGIQSDNVWVRLFKPESFTPLLAIAGVIMLLSGRTSRRKNIGSVLIGFSILMFGMQVMTQSMAPLTYCQGFQNCLVAFTNPVLGLIVGAVITAIIQSSAASVGILQALSMTGHITYGIALPIIMGQNIGTCITAFLSSIGVNANARKVAVVHVAFNVIGTLVFLAIFEAIQYVFKLKFVTESINPAGIAIVHSIFNIVTTIILFPFIKQLESIANFVIKSKGKEDRAKVILDERLLLSPDFAIAECFHKTIKMSSIVEKNVVYATKLLKRYETKKAEVVNLNEKTIDMYEDKLETFLIKASNKEMSEEASASIGRLLLNIGDFERIGDHAIGILNIAERMNEKKLRFSEQAIDDIKIIVYAVLDVMKLATTAYADNNEEIALNIEPLEQVVDRLIRKAKKRHIKRLQEGRCTVELDLMVSDLFNDLERISDHCSNIGTSILQIKDSSIDKHEFINRLRSMDNTEFSKKYDEYKAKYPLVNV